MKKRYRTLLENAKEKIRSGWCQQFLAIDKNGEEIDATNDATQGSCTVQSRTCFWISDTLGGWKSSPKQSLSLASS